MSLDPLTIWTTIAVLALATLLTRGSFFLFLHGMTVPPRVQASLRFIPPAVFAALVVPELALIEGRLALGGPYDRLIAGIVAGIVAWRTKSSLLTILAGMLVLHAARLAM